jgi:predicted Rossmann fold flavoprotein
LEQVDVIILGAGAAGLMCAIESGKRGKKTLILDKANKVGKKILMSGGGRCNFTNYEISPDKYCSHNRHFCKSALSRYTQWDFIALVEKYGIAYFEKEQGQLFCQDKAKDITNMLLCECEKYPVAIKLRQQIANVYKKGDDFFVETDNTRYVASKLVIATGGLSIPTMGASPLGYQIASQFGLNVFPTRAALVPFTLQDECKKRFSPLTGISVDCLVHCNDIAFQDKLLFTHRGLSGPAMLQISSYWQPGDVLKISLVPTMDLIQIITQMQQHQPEAHLKTLLARHFAKRMLSVFIPENLLNKAMIKLSQNELGQISKALQHWQIKPNNTEGYRTAEVTLGGVDCDEISSKTFESHKVPGLYFVGEVLDVTGWLGGYNFQWAWSSGWAAGQVV